MSFTRNVILASSVLIAMNSAMAQESESQSERAGMGYLGAKVGYLKFDDFYSEVYESAGSVSYGIDGAYLHQLTEGGFAVGAVGSWFQSSFDASDGDITTDYSFFGGGPAIGYMNDQDAGRGLLYLGYEFLDLSIELSGDDCSAGGYDFCDSDLSGSGNAITAGYLFQPEDVSWAAGINVRSLESEGQDNPFEISFTFGLAF